MRRRVSRQRRETAKAIAQKLLDSDYRRRIGVDASSEVTVLVALWNDPVSKVLQEVKDRGGSAVVGVVRPDGLLASMVLNASRAADDAPGRLTASRESIGALVDSIGREGSFPVVLESAAFGRFDLAVA